ncbi:H-NS histone family protein [Cupriavidus sp. IDO]|uniref:H-NS histone family protein n=1 Tax=Cupriavidus sp. IDO TaxID=1539142 RepID=UPI000690E330|nr:DNA-binding protein [Cupriavidus sp. IDO]
MTAKNERAAAIRWIQDQMADYGLTIDELKAAGCFDPPPPPPALVVCYRNAERLHWDGQGEMPSWLKRAVIAGGGVFSGRIAPQPIPLQ